MKHSKLIDKLKNNISVKLPWIAPVGKNIGIVIWNNNGKAVFTENDTGINLEVIDLENESLVSEAIENFIKEGYGTEQRGGWHNGGRPKGEPTYKETLNIKESLKEKMKGLKNKDKVVNSLLQEYFDKIDNMIVEVGNLT